MDVRSMVVAWPDQAPRGAVARFCRDNEISRSRFYEIRARAQSEPVLSAMQPLSRVPPARHSQAIALDIEELAVRIRKELADDGWDHGPVSVRHRLFGLGVAAPATSTLARVFTRRGMVVAQPQKRPKTSYRRFEFAMVHQCWQLDAFEWALADDSVCAVFQLLDDHSRFMVASHVAPGETNAGSLAVVSAGIERFQAPTLLLTDNGGAFNSERIGRRTELVTMLRALGTKPITGKPGHPQTQGKDERVHATLQRWLRARPAAATLPELQALVDEFDLTYNHHRPHQALQMRTPAQALEQGVVAIAPLPPDPEALAKAAPMRLIARRTDGKGRIVVNQATINVGVTHARTQVGVMTTPDSIYLFTAAGTLIRSITLTPGQTYYGIRRPRGTGRHPNHPH